MTIVEKPLELIKFYIVNLSNEDNFDFDPFVGGFSLTKTGCSSIEKLYQQKLILSIISTKNKY